MYCHKCGKEIDGSASFCPACGKPVPEGQQQRVGAGPMIPPAPMGPAGQLRQPPVPAGYPPPQKSSSFPAWLLVLIIVLVAIVVASPLIIAVPVYMNSRSNAQRRTCQSNLRTVDGAIQAYESMFAEPAYPTRLEDLIQPGTQVLKTIPTCPLSDKPYGFVEGDPPYISCPNDGTHKI